uniref:Uncharacterized protein n=1 Tax=Quercus lobata TaxID=97700 RepID=A0A7N2M227_QUELO
MGRQLCENRFDIEACFFTMMPSRMKVESLVSPNLKLKVLIEAIRMVLEIVYDERFVNFYYGEHVDTRLQKNQENTKFESEELISVSGMFYKPASEDVCGQVFG